MTTVPLHHAGRPRLRFHPTAFVFALVLAPVWVTILTGWTIISLFALPLGAPAYLIVGTPALLWAVGWMQPGFSNYALFGLMINCAAWAIGLILLIPSDGVDDAFASTTFYFGFGLLYAPLYAGTFGALYARWNPYIKTT